MGRKSFYPTLDPGSGAGVTKERETVVVIAVRWATVLPMPICFPLDSSGFSRYILDLNGEQPNM